jgi:hypothetical protein
MHTYTHAKAQGNPTPVRNEVFLYALAESWTTTLHVYKCMYMYVMHACMRVCVCVYASMHVWSISVRVASTSISVRVVLPESWTTALHVCTCMYMYLCYACMYVCMYAYTYACIYVCLCIYAYMCVYIYTRHVPEKAHMHMHAYMYVCLCACIYVYSL